MKLSSLLPVARDPRGPGGLMTSMAFLISAGIGIWLTGDCIVREGASRCASTAGAGAAIVLAGAGMKAANEAGFQTLNPALAPLRKREEEEGGPDGVDPPAGPDPRPVSPDFEFMVSPPVAPVDPDAEMATVNPLIQSAVEAAVGMAADRLAEELKARMTPKRSPSRATSGTRRAKE